MQATVKKKLIEYVVTVLLAAIMAFNYILFIVPNSFAPAGLNGIATMVQHLVGFSIGWMSLIINIPLCVFAFFCVDRDFACKTLAFCLVYSGVYLLLQQFDVSRFQYDAGGVDTIYPCLIAGIINGVLYGV
ncbi:MAG: YitT family protein, partial [Clostridiales bacterium]|nr:YitT family protein [Clostridiales bacterium]